MKREEKLKEKLKAMKAFEDEYYNRGIYNLAGIDEVGRGPLAGPVVAAAVILPQDFDVLGIDDSKKLSPKKREELFVQITEKCFYGVGMCDHEVVDKVNILEATKLAMKEAINNLNKERSIDVLLIDAVSLKDVDIPQKSIIKGDSISVSIAAASIVAKVIRDDIMDKYHEKYPYYSFNSNKGYGTKAHYAGINDHGLCPIHRKTFLKKYI